MILWLKTLKVGKSYSQNHGAKINHMKFYIIPIVKQNLHHILHTGTNDLKNIDTPEEIAREMLILAMTCKSDTNSVLKSGIVSRPDTNVM